MATVLDGLDWLKWFRLLQADKADLMSGAISEQWVEAQCRIASRILLNDCPYLETRYRNRRIDEETIAYVVTNMVARVAIWRLTSTESNGIYTTSFEAPKTTPPGFTPSPNLYVKKSEKALVNGDDGSGPMGTFGIGLERMWGG